MCDTILAPPGSTAEHVMLFGKNSDRQRNEAQAVELMPRAEHAPGSQLKCTYISIPQAPRTHAVLLCRPFWLWGAEMGANEHGVVIGNEGLHARCPAPQEDALTGMDLLRLALERSSSAAEAVEVITTLLEQYGQGGNCGHLIPSYYNNGFLIADHQDAFVLETIGKEWLSERVGGVRSMSNIYSITSEVEKMSAGLSGLIRDSGWSEDPKQNYADAIANPNREHIGQARARHARSTGLLRSRDGSLGVADMMAVLRDHGAQSEPHGVWHPEIAVNISLCMHAGADERPGQSAGSLVSELRKSHAVHWVTATAAPCTSIFKPVLIEAELPAQGPRLTDRYDPATLWWRHERLHRAALRGDFAKFLEEIRPERAVLEARFQSRMNAVFDGGNASDRSLAVAQCWKEALAAEDRWLARVDRAAAPAATPYHSSWLKMNQLAGLVSEEAS
jgi:secernin